MKLNRLAIILAVVLCGSGWAVAEFNPFASSVIDISLNPGLPAYLPAPGQRINQPYWNNPAKALGPVNGGGLMAPNNDSVVTLGGFGGQLVLSFDHDVQDNPANPMGLDATVFSNAFWTSGDEQVHWAELATIEIMPELNGNNIPGDAPGERWYLIPGSHLANGGNYREQRWDRTAGPQVTGYYPNFANWPNFYTTGAHELRPVLQTVYGKEAQLVNPNYLDDDEANDHLEGYWGYAGYSPTLKLGDRNGDDSTTAFGDEPDMEARLFYTTPDDPFTVGITPGSGGGDSFDIQWAVDPVTWLPAGLTSFRYIRITTAVDAVVGEGGFLGEISIEVDGVADVRMICDLDGDNDADHDDFDAMEGAMGRQWGEPGFLPAADIVVDYVVDEQDWQAFAQAWLAVTLPGDANLDGVVDLADYTIWADNFGSTSAGWRGDFNMDGVVDLADYTIWADNFGAGQSINVPEP